jgi:hypothetical protein
MNIRNKFRTALTGLALLTLTSCDGIIDRKLTHEEETTMKQLVRFGKQRKVDAQVEFEGEIDGNYVRLITEIYAQTDRPDTPENERRRTVLEVISPKSYQVFSDQDNDAGEFDMACVYSTKHNLPGTPLKDFTILDKEKNKGWAVEKEAFCGTTTFNEDVYHANIGNKLKMLRHIRNIGTKK